MPSFFKGGHKNCPELWLLNQRGYLLLLFTYGCRRRAMLSFWQLWLGGFHRFSINIDVCETLMPPFPNMTFDLDLWPTDLKINRDHLLIKDYLPTKFEASGAKPSWVISCTRLRATDIPTDGRTNRPTDRCSAICPSFFKGGHKYKDWSTLFVVCIGKWKDTGHM